MCGRLPQRGGVDRGDGLAAVRRLLPVLAVLMIGCQQQADGNYASAGNQPAPAPEPRELTDEMARNGFDPRQNLSVTDNPEAQVGTTAGTLPPAGRKLRFLGTWASSVANCRANAWRFTGTSLDTPAGSHCDFRNVRSVPGGYDIAAVCTAESPPTADKLNLRFAESATAMLFESETIADVGLVYCGD
jgi:hypothetical protein